MLYFTEYQIIKYFSAMLWQNAVPEKKNEILKLGKKNAVIEILMVYIYIYICVYKPSDGKFLSKFQDSTCFH